MTANDKAATAPAREVPQQALRQALSIHHEWSIRNMPGYNEHGDERVAYRATVAALSPQPVQRQVSDEREAFERVHLGGVKKLARRNEHGEYVAPSINDAWAGWQSARSLAQPADGDGVALPDGGQQ